MKIFICCLFIIGLFAVDEVDKTKISVYITISTCGLTDIEIFQRWC